MDISLDADTARAEGFEERNVALVVVVRVDGDGISITKECLMTVVPYLGALVAEVVETEVIWVI